MKSITLHNLEDELYSMISLEAKKNRRSMNQEIKDKLYDYFLKKTNVSADLSFTKYLGIWSETDYQEFKDKTADFEKISGVDWE